MCIQTGKKLSDENRMRMDTDADVPQKRRGDARGLPAVRGSHRPHRRNRRSAATSSLSSGTIHLPDFPVPDNEPHDHYLHRLCVDGAIARYGSLDALDGEVGRRLEYELGDDLPDGICRLFPDCVGFYPLRPQPGHTGRAGAEAAAQAPSCAYCAGHHGHRPASNTTCSLSAS